MKFQLIGGNQNSETVVNFNSIFALRVAIKLTL